jgi:drug/metabolite transporter (DMT)-like permease
MIAVAITWNIFYYQGVQKENLAEFELIMLLSPLATIMFAELLLPAERNLNVFLAGTISSFALIISRFRHHHVVISSVAKKTLVAMLLMSLESILIKELLASLSPVSLYFSRTLVIAIVFIALYRPKMLSLSAEAYGLTIISAMFGVVQMVLKFYGFQNLGVIETTMVLLLGPSLVYLFCYLYFKERLYKRDLVALLTIVLSILYVEFWK